MFIIKKNLLLSEGVIHIIQLELNRNYNSEKLFNNI